MRKLLNLFLFLFLFCLGTGEKAISSEGTIHYTVQGLIEKITESENRIKNVQAEYLFFEPDTNLPLLYAQWAYQPDKELLTGMRYSREGSDPGYAISRKIMYSLHDCQRFFHFSEDLLRGRKSLIITEPKLIEGDTFTVFLTPNSLLGFGFGLRLPLGQALKKAQKVTITEQSEQIDGYRCCVLEAIGIANPESVFDIRAWIDTGRDFRPLRVESYYNTIGGRQYQPFERLVRRIFDIKLRRIDGIWFPIEGKRATFRYEEVLPPELEGLTEEQARQKFSEQELEKLIKKIKEKPVLSAPPRKTLVDVSSVRINHGIEQNRFVIKPPDGCGVWDEIEDTNYTVKDGEGEELKFDVSFLKLKRFAPPEFMKVIYPDTLIGCTIPDLNRLPIRFDSDPFKDKLHLFCIWDMQQRPSRTFIKILSDQRKALERKGLVVIGVQVARVDENELKEWTTTNRLSIQNVSSKIDALQPQFAWAAKSLPWLILTNRYGVVVAEGFDLDELDETIKEINDEKR